MKFYPVYYFTLACPTIEKTLEMVDRYLEKSAIRGIQIDMPSADPYGETDLVKKRMADAIEQYRGDYDVFMDAILSIRKKHPVLEIHVVVYPDVIDTIGIERFTQFCKEVGAFTVRVAGTEVFADYIAYLDKSGLPTSDYINYARPDDDIQRCSSTTGVIHMRTRRKTEAVNKELESWDARIQHVRAKGVTARIFATADMTTADDLVVVREAGADGAYVGNVLMRLWENEDALWQLLDEMQATCVE